MNKLYYAALGLGLAITFSQSNCLAQVNPWQDVQPQQSNLAPAPSSGQTLNGGGQQTAITGKQQTNLPIVRMGGMANGSAAGQGSAGSSPYSFGFTGGAPSGNGGFTGLPPTSTGSCLGIDILGGGGGGTGMGGPDSGAGNVGASASVSGTVSGATTTVTTGTSATIVSPGAAAGGSSSPSAPASSGF